MKGVKTIGVRSKLAGAEGNRGMHGGETTGATFVNPAEDPRSSKKREIVGVSFAPWPGMVVLSESRLFQAIVRRP